MKIITTLISLFYFVQLNGQVPTSLSLSSYAGIDRIHLNPALGLESAYKWDLNLLGGQLHAFTDYAFVRKASLLNLSGQLSNASVIDARTAIPEQSADPLVIFDLDGGKKKLQLRGRINGPSFTYSLKDDLRVGVFTAFRAHVSSTNIPENFGIYELNQSYETNIVNIDPGTMSGATWMEIGVHFSKEIDQGSFGFNIKMLRANEGGYIDSDLDVDLQFVDSILAVNGNTNLDIAFTTPSIDANSYQSGFNGSGIGIDLGFTYQHDLGTFGFSIMDIGALQFKNNVEIYTPQILSGLTDVRTQDFRGFSDVRSLLDQLQSDLLIEPDRFGVFSIGLPTRLSLFGDYQYNQDISISANLNQRLPLFGKSLKANNTLVITPRFERGLYSFFLPITVYEYSSMRIGTAFRIGPLTIGSDHITSVLFPHEFKGSDVFFSLNLYPFWQEGNGRNSKGRGKGVLCPQF